MTFRFRATLHPIAALAVVLFACQSSEERTAFPSTSRDPNESPPPSSDDEADRVDATSPIDAGPAKKDEPELDLPTNDAGCLAWEAAEQVCGVDSDETVCELAVSCGTTADVGTCKINCEMQTTINCYSNADAKCLLDAAKAKSCSKLSACKWKL